MGDSNDKPRVAILAPYYIPFTRGGGPIQSLANLVSRMSNVLDFSVITSDRDLGETSESDSVTINRWTTEGEAHVYRAPQNCVYPWTLARLAREARSDMVYTNGLFHMRFCIFPALASRSGMLPMQLLIAPRGELYPGALALRPLKKRIFLSVARLFRIYKNARWHATNEEEAAQIRRTFPRDSADITIASNMSQAPARTLPAGPDKRAGAIRLIFVSRIADKKGLHLALSSLKELKGDIQFDIYGPIENPAYWKRCLQVIKQLPPNIRVSHHGTVRHEDIRGKLHESHVFILPTLGENFGHAIFEALAAGRPVIISDQTPWKHLEEVGAGFALPLSVDRFARSVDYFVAMGASEYEASARSALGYAQDFYAGNDKFVEYLRLFSRHDATDQTGERRR